MTVGPVKLKLKPHIVVPFEDGLRRCVDSFVAVLAQYPDVPRMEIGRCGIQDGLTLAVEAGFKGWKHYPLAQVTVDGQRLDDCPDSIQVAIAFKPAPLLAETLFGLLREFGVRGPVTIDVYEGFPIFGLPQMAKDGAATPPSPRSAGAESPAGPVDRAPHGRADGSAPVEGEGEASASPRLCANPEGEVRP